MIGICILTFYIETLIQLLIILRTFFEYSLESFMKSIMSFENKDSFNHFFTIYMYFIYFSWFITLSKTSGKILAKTDVLHCFLPDFGPRAKAKSVFKNIVRFLGMRFMFFINNWSSFLKMIFSLSFFSLFHWLQKHSYLTS